MYFWGLVKKVVQQVEDLSFFLLFLLFYKKVKKSEKKYKKVFSTFPDAVDSLLTILMSSLRNTCHVDDVGLAAHQPHPPQTVRSSCTLPTFLPLLFVCVPPELDCASLLVDACSQLLRGIYRHRTPAD